MVGYKWEKIDNMPKFGYLKQASKTKQDKSTSYFRFTP
jgi:hypothetical protein